MEPKMTPRGLFASNFKMDLVGNFIGQQLWGLLGFLIIHWCLWLLHRWCIGQQEKDCVYIMQEETNRNKDICI